MLTLILLWARKHLDLILLALLIAAVVGYITVLRAENAHLQRTVGAQREQIAAGRAALDAANRRIAVQNAAVADWRRQARATEAAVSAARARVTETQTHTRARVQRIYQTRIEPTCAAAMSYTAQRLAKVAEEWANETP